MALSGCPEPAPRRHVEVTSVDDAERVQDRDRDQPDEDHVGPIPFDLAHLFHPDVRARRCPSPTWPIHPLFLEFSEPKWLICLGGVAKTAVVKTKAIFKRGGVLLSGRDVFTPNDSQEGW